MVRGQSDTPEAGSDLVNLGSRAKSLLAGVMGWAVPTDAQPDGLHAGARGASPATSRGSAVAGWASTASVALSEGQSDASQSRGARAGF